MITKFKRLFRRLRCKHQNYVWLRENTTKPKGGVYPVKCCLDCGKLTWAVFAVCGPVRYVRFLNPGPGITITNWTPVKVDSFVPPTASGDAGSNK